MRLAALVIMLLSGELGAATPPQLGSTTIYFATGSAQVPRTAGTMIDDVVRWQIEHPLRLLLVEGYADRTGGEQANLTLSQDRADAVRDALVRAGADPLRMVSAAHGEWLPAHDLASSRRVVITGTIHTYEDVVRGQHEGDRPVPQHMR